MKIAVITDTHWGVRGDSTAFHDNFAKFYCNVFFPEIDKRGIKTVLHLGDLVDARKRINFLTANQMNRHFIQPLLDRNIDTHIVVGNHDTSYKNTNEINSLRELYADTDLNLYWDGPVELDFDGCKIMLSPWICDANYQKSMQAFHNTSAQILMGHFEISGYEMMKGRLCDHGLDHKVFKKFDSVYSGHFHHPSSQGNITYLGAPYEMTWTDQGGKRGFHIFDTDTREMEFIENPYRMFHVIRYDDTGMTVEDVEALDTSLMESSYVKIIVDDKTNPQVFDMFKERLEESGISDLKIVEDAEVLQTDDRSIDLDEAQDTLSILKKYIDSLDVKVDKKSVDKMIEDLYIEAINL